MMYPMRPILSFLTEADIAFFWSKVHKAGPDECWPFGNVRWTYGKFSARGRTITAHRVSWVIHHQEELGDRLACHSCDYKPCVNPGHIWPGTYGDNARDRSAKQYAAYLAGKRTVGRR